MSWFLDSLKLDFEVLSRSLAQYAKPQAAARPTRSDADDLAA